MTNRLGDATSPYLLQHKDNPVDWWMWGEDAFAEARRRDIPVFLSVGYAACHWCHVMAHESFEDDATAMVLNAGFVSIKVDREERPDIDAVYMAALQGLTGHGGWPMTVFLNHEQQPFHAGTYFPLEARSGMPSFQQVLAGVSNAWVQRRSEIDEGAAGIAERLSSRQNSGLQTGNEPIDRAQLAAGLSIALQRAAHDFDPVNAGFGSAPKFPPSTVLEWLLRHYQRTGASEALNMVEDTCEAMARGGIYDQLGGGFARYSVDAKWIVPHFEKMLYDNAQLLRVYSNLYATTGDELARRVGSEIGEFMLRDLRTANGGFASAFDADAPAVGGGHAHEGLSYVWTPGQLESVLGPDDAELAAEVFGVTVDGTFEDGASVLQLPARAESMSSVQQSEEFAVWFARVRRDLLSARDLRPQPARDDKVIAAWNGLAIAALADAGTAFQRPEWIAAAAECGDMLLNLHSFRDDDGLLRLHRASRDGVVAHNAAGVLEDYADVAEGFLALYRVSADFRWLERAGDLLETVLRRFIDLDGGFFDTSDDAERLIVRTSDPMDQASASGWSAVTQALLSYGVLMASERHLRAAEVGLGIANQLARNAPRFSGWLLAAAEAWLDGPIEIIIVDRDDSPDAPELLSSARAQPRPGTLLVVGVADGDAKVGPFSDRPLVDGMPTAYVCRGSQCYAPVTSAVELAKLIESVSAG